MIKGINITPIILLFIIGISFTLRFWNFGQFPGSGETKDEYAWSWLGESLLSGRPPTSWSWFDHYKNKNIVTLDSNRYPIAYPVFDNPPLFSIIPGLMLTIRGIHGIQIPSITLIRWPMLFIGTINVLLVYIVGILWRNKQQAMIAASLMATIPTIVFASRMVLAENLLVTFMLLILIFIRLFETSKKNLWLYIAGAISGLCILTKVLGVFIPAAIFFYLIITKQRRSALIFLLTSGVIASLWLAYALFYGFDTFITTQLAQSSLSIGWGSLINIFLRFFIVDQSFLDGWMILGIIVLFAQFFQNLSQGKSIHDPIHLLFVFWLIFFVAAVGEQTWHGWYKYPLHPLMVFQIASIVSLSYKKVTSLIPLYLVGFLSTLRLLLVMLGIQASSTTVRLGVFIVVLLLTTDQIFNMSERNRQLLSWALIILVVIVNSLLILNFNPHLLHEDYLKFYPPGAIL